MTTVLHISDLHFGRPSSSDKLDVLEHCIRKIGPDAIAVSGDLTQRCTNREFVRARQYLDTLGKIAPCIVIPGNHDIRWLGAVIRNLGVVGLIGNKAHDFKYSRYRRHISKNLSPSLEIPGAVIAGLNTAHGISRGSLTRRFRDLGVIGHVKREDVQRVERAFSNAAPEAARIVMIHHNPIKGSLSGRHGLANTGQALRAFAEIGAEIVLCGHDHLEAVHTVEELAPGLIISTAGTISNRLRPNRPSSFNLVSFDEADLRIQTYYWQDLEGFVPAKQLTFSRRTAFRSA
ncbi:MAG: metallophosphoesterase family protein [Rubrobacteraceae bacterium]